MKLCPVKRAFCLVFFIFSTASAMRNRREVPLSGRSPVICVLVVRKEEFGRNQVNPLQMRTTRDRPSRQEDFMCGLLRFAPCCVYGISSFFLGMLGGLVAEKVVNRTEFSKWILRGPIRFHKD